MTQEWDADELASFLVEEKERLLGPGCEEDWDLEALMEAVGLDVAGATSFVRHFAEGQQLELEMMAAKALEEGNAARLRLAQMYIPLMTLTFGAMIGRSMKQGDDLTKGDTT